MLVFVWSVVSNFFVLLESSFVKMFHLCPACNLDVHSSKRKVFMLCWVVHVCLYATIMLSRCSTFGQLFVKMFHLLAREVVFMHVYVCVCMRIVCVTFVL